MSTAEAADRSLAIPGETGTCSPGIRACGFWTRLAAKSGSRVEDASRTRRRPTRTTPAAARPSTSRAAPPAASRSRAAARPTATRASPATRTRLSAPAGRIPVSVRATRSTRPAGLKPSANRLHSSLAHLTSLPSHLENSLNHLGCITSVLKSFVEHLKCVLAHLEHSLSDLDSLAPWLRFCLPDLKLFLASLSSSAGPLDAWPAKLNPRQQSSQFCAAALKSHGALLTFRVKPLMKLKGS